MKVNRNSGKRGGDRISSTDLTVDNLFMEGSELELIYKDIFFKFINHKL